MLVGGIHESPLQLQLPTLFSLLSAPRCVLSHCIHFYDSLFCSKNELAGWARLGIQSPPLSEKRRRALSLLDFLFRIEYIPLKRCRGKTGL
jgi:hypothetical protein